MSDRKTKTSWTLVGKVAAVGDLVLKDPRNEEDQAISEWLDTEPTGKVSIRYDQNTGGPYKKFAPTVNVFVTFTKLADAVKFKMDYGDYLVGYA